MKCGIYKQLNLYCEKKICFRLYREISKTGSLFAGRVALSTFKIDGLQEGTGKLLTRSNKLNLQCILKSMVMLCKGNGHYKKKECWHMCGKSSSVVVLNASPIYTLCVKFNDSRGWMNHKMRVR